MTLCYRNLYVDSPVITVNTNNLHDFGFLFFVIVSLSRERNNMSLGVGVYILTVLWFVTFMLCWVSVRTGHNVGKIAIIVSFVVTFILLLLPKGDEDYSYDADFYDRLFVARYAIFTFLLISVVLGLAYCFIYVCLTPIETKKVKGLAYY